MKKNINTVEFDTVFFDLDGTLYEGSKIIDGANMLVNYFRNIGKRVFFVTNNSTKTRKQIYERLVKIGIDAELEEVLTSGFVAANYAREMNMKDIHIFGSVNLIHEFQNMGVSVNQDTDAENLLIGYDPDMTYEDLTRAVRVALNAKHIIACNKERVYPGEQGLLFPGCGAMVAPVEWCSGKKADLVIGKPNTLMIDYIVNAYGLDCARILVIGDTYESDIEMAKQADAVAILISDKDNCDVLTFPSVREIYHYFSFQGD